MKIALLGYGKMGKTIEKIALSEGHEIVLKIGSKNLHELTAENLRKADACKQVLPIFTVNLFLCRRIEF